jgi:GrpB-like predicted nucleotidyltransferase (UPF0157 family)
MAAVTIYPYDPGWPDDFNAVGHRLRGILGDRATRIDHIGSTSVPGLDAKNVIDVQVSVANEAELEAASGELEVDGWLPSSDIRGDHPVPGLSPDPDDWKKNFFSEPVGVRRVNLHVRVEGRPNQRYALLFRDYLRTHPTSARSYEALKHHLASLLPDDAGRYADVKDPACDLIYFAAEQWAADASWLAGSSDA